MIFVKTLTGKTITLYIKEGARLKHIDAAFRQKEGDCGKVRWSQSSRQLHSDDVMNIQSEETIHITIHFGT